MDSRWTLNLEEAREYVHRLIQANPGLLDMFRDPEQSAAAGLDQQFLDKLDRVDKDRLKSDDDCPICASTFLDDKYPLVVSLPCPGRHRFDLDCVGPWLLKHKTCPMCRHDVSQKKKIDIPEDSEEEYDDMYA